MIQAFSIVRATALEILSEPLTLLTVLASLSIALFAPTFHYHQFGEATRMARDAGFSATLVGGCVLAVFGTIRAFRREIESGTLEMTLAHPISPARFFLFKALGSLVATGFVMTLVFATAVVMVEGAAEGGRIAERVGDILRIWGPCVSICTVVMVLPLVIGAVLNRFARFRFVLTSVLLAGLLAAAGGAWALVRDTSLLGPYLPAAVPLFLLAALFVSAAAAFAFRFHANAAAALTGLAALAFLPFVGNYYLADALSNGGRVAWTHVGWSAVAIAPAIAAFLVFGCGRKTGMEET